MPRCFALIPCAGQGRRACNDDTDSVPKQYWLIHNKPMLWYALAMLSEHPAISLTTLVLAPHDIHFDQQFEPYQFELGWGTPACRWQIYHCGGTTRQASVINGLAFLAQTEVVQENDWILVHDAARPGITTRMLSELINTVRDHEVGGILALPLADTLKRANLFKDTPSQMSEIDETLARDGLWQAQTPQIFRFGLLQNALKQAQERGEIMTDEAAAIEKLGLKPLLIPGSLRNFKVTYAHDLAFVQALMSVDIV